MRPEIVWKACIKKTTDDRRERYERIQRLSQWSEGETSAMIFVTKRRDLTRSAFITVYTISAETLCRYGS